MKSGAKGAENFLSIKIGQFFSPNIWQTMTFLSPRNALIPKIPFSFFPDFWVWVTSEARGVSLGRILGVLSIEPFLVGGGSGWRALSTPPPPGNENPASPMVELLLPVAYSPA